MKKVNQCSIVLLFYTRNEDDALEIVQETVYKAFISIKQLKEPAYFRTWLTRVLINCAINYIKKQERIIPFSEPIPNRVASANTTHVEDKMDLSSAIDQLEEKLKTVVILKYYHDLTIVQIAEILECPVGTVKTRLHNALKKLRVELKEVCVNE
ncbi:sigma-70 family RNA polymerase sigma factor [Ammoniphilus resinae]|uniref:RNA polymerase sigma-70 factor (ECF subfamily) n=1 Tax=Ammoniphilus resinae TaxID=861532 RepID=A0ABS4GPL6_9BACL|nr:sigma-70 family RNA polymerase sigma factor [Ammoniphilus resinae]MBP1932002.1 RNA polymerase sigma-70 factor (ECF subfamily) [Ammoniphilus resinae]